MSKEKLKNKGITLIALIITIIVMLILTGVTLSITLGDNGLVNKAKEATTQTQVAMDRELLLSAVVGAIGNDGKVNLSAINLPEGFTGSNGTYTSKNGNAFSVSENGEIVLAGNSDSNNEIETITLNGKYYCYPEQMDAYYEIRNNNEFGDGEEFVPIIIDEENQLITDTEVGDVLDSFTYEYVIENGKVVNVLLVGLDGNATFWRNQNGFVYDLNGVYGCDDNNDGQIDCKMIFNSENKTIIVGNIINGDTWEYDSYYIEGSFYGVNGHYNIIHDSGEISGMTASEDLNTIIYRNKTYTKQSI